jgi:hypothetical protein
VSFEISGVSFTKRALVVCVRKHACNVAWLALHGAPQRILIAFKAAIKQQLQVGASDVCFLHAAIFGTSYKKVNELFSID